MSIQNIPNKTLFISYSRRQLEWCDELYHAIDNETNYQRWRDNKIPGSADWWEKICLNIEGCFAFISILSDDYLKSKYCMAELDYAIRLGKPIIALLLEDNTEYPSKLEEDRLQFIKVNNSTILQVINKILNALIEITQLYVGGRYVLNINARPELRPKLGEDKFIGQNTTVYGDKLEKAYEDIIIRYNDLKRNDPKLALEFLMSSESSAYMLMHLNLEAEVMDLKQNIQNIESTLETLRIRNTFTDLKIHVTKVSPSQAINAIQRFIEIHPDFADAQRLLKRFLPKKTSLLQWDIAQVNLRPKVTIEKSVKGVLSAPFEWIGLPKFRCKISKYPITNAQYSVFVESGGYKNKKWWTNIGWQLLNEHGWEQPYFWDYDEYNNDDQPVVGVSWFEAIAFCYWLGMQVNEEIVLPSEEKWIHAANGDTDWTFPWGNEWDSTKCRNSVEGNVSYHGNTSTVKTYEEKGQSPLGVIDMIGNAWEWCLTDYHHNTNHIHLDAESRVLKGGAWDVHTPVFFAIDTKNGNFPYVRNDYYGFRIVSYSYL